MFDLYINLSTRSNCYNITYFIMQTSGFWVKSVYIAIMARFSCNKGSFRRLVFSFFTTIYVQSEANVVCLSIVKASTFSGLPSHFSHFHVTTINISQPHVFSLYFRSPNTIVIPVSVQGCTETGTLDGERRRYPVKKTLNCRYCSKRFRNTSNRKQHERVHTGEKPFRCKHCDKSFCQLGNMQRHERAHTGEKPYKCEECARCFSDVRSLRNHVKVHKQEQPCRYDQFLIC